MNQSSNIIECDFLDLSFREDLNIILARWRKKVPSQDLKTGYNRLLELALEKGNQFWFLDLRRRGPLSADDENWILNSFFAKLQTTNPEPHYFAYLVSPTHLHQIDKTIGLERLRNFNDWISISVFNAEDVAIGWLQNMQRIQSVPAS